MQSIHSYANILSFPPYVGHINYSSETFQICKKAKINCSYEQNNQMNMDVERRLGQQQQLWHSGCGVHEAPWGMQLKLLDNSENKLHTESQSEFHHPQITPLLSRSSSLCVDVCVCVCAAVLISFLCDPSLCGHFPPLGSVRLFLWSSRRVSLHFPLSLPFSRSFPVLSRAQCLPAYAVYWIFLHSLLLRRVTVTTEGFKSHSALGLAMCQGLLDIHIPSPRSLPPTATTPLLRPPLPCYPPFGVVRVLRQLTVHTYIDFRAVVFIPPPFAL